MSRNVNINMDEVFGTTRAVPGVNCNEEPENRQAIDTSKLAKIMVTHEQMANLLGLPEDVQITSMHTSRGEADTGIYMICDRFEQVPAGGVAPEMTIEEVGSRGLWDSEGNNA